MYQYSKIRSLELITLYSEHIKYLINRGVGKKTRFGNEITVEMISNMVKRRDYLKSRSQSTMNDPVVEKILNNILKKEGLK